MRVISPVHNDSARLAWLNDLWSEQRRRLTGLWERIGDLGVVQGMKPKTFQKFLKLISQIANIKDDEVRILGQIEAIERKHRFQRKMHRVKYVGTDNEKWAREFVDERCEQENEECARPLSNWQWWAEAQQLYGLLAAVDAANCVEQKSVGHEVYEIPASGKTPAPEKQKSSRWFLWLVVFWYLMSRPAPISAKSQSLTAD